jgi:probable rRNA maturation factor
MPVDVSQNAGRGATVGVEAAGERILALLGCGECELSVLLTDDRAIRTLNRRWRGKNAATDVLSFSQLEIPARSRNARRPAALRRPTAGEHLGDVVISVETARRQARAGGWALREELNRLLVHGVLHLLGHDHEHGGAQEARMKAEEVRLSSALVAGGVPCACEEKAE